MRFVVPSVISTRVEGRASPRRRYSSLSMAASCLASNSAMIVPAGCRSRRRGRVWRARGRRQARRRPEDGEDAHRRACGFGAAVVLDDPLVRPRRRRCTTAAASSLPSCASRAVAEASGVLVRGPQHERCKRTRRVARCRPLKPGAHATHLAPSVRCPAGYGAGGRSGRALPARVVMALAPRRPSKTIHCARFRPQTALAAGSGHEMS